MACCLVSRKLKSSKQDYWTNSGQLKAAMGDDVGGAFDYTVEITGTSNSKNDEPFENKILSCIMV